MRQPRCANMKFVGILAGYLAAAGALFGALAGGVLWLIQPGEATAEKRVAPIPPRIAESIERKSAPMMPEPVAVMPVSEAKPAMQEAPVALPHHYRIIEREVALPNAVHRPATQPRKKTQASASPAAEPAPAATRAVSTARSDFPY